jgi:hypothetical protein
MKDSAYELVERLHREEIERAIRQRQVPPSQQPPQEYPGLPEMEPASLGEEEWNLFRRELGRLIQDGHRGRFALIKAGEPISVWDTRKDAVQAGQLLYPQVTCLIQQILPYLRPLRTGFIGRCRD